MLLPQSGPLRRVTLLHSLLKRLAVVVSILCAAIAAVSTAHAQLPTFQECPTAAGQDVLFVVDNSGSINTTEYTGFANGIRDVAAQIHQVDPTVRIGVVHFGGPTTNYMTGGQNFFIERDFSTAAVAAPVRQYGTGGAFNSGFVQDYLAGALFRLQEALDNNGGTTSSFADGAITEFSVDPTRRLSIVVATDAIADIGSCCSSLIDRAGSAAQPDDGSTFTIFNQYKAVNTNFVVWYSGGSDSTAAAIASVGGTYNGTVVANPSDPEGSATTPRRFRDAGFTLSVSEILYFAGEALCPEVKVDRDADGVDDSLDLDDDGDGILDVNECSATNLLSGGSFERADLTNTSGIISSSNGDFDTNAPFASWTKSGTVDWTEGQYVDSSDSTSHTDEETDGAGVIPSPFDAGGFAIFSISGETISQTFATVVGETYTATYQIGVMPDYRGTFAYTVNLEFGVDAVPLLTEADIRVPPASSYPTETAFETADAGPTAIDVDPNWQVVSQTFVATSTTTTLVFRNLTSASVVVVDGISAVLGDNPCDVDRDGIPNKNDLDSDGDGIVDLRETNARPAVLALDTNGDGSVSVAEAEALLGAGNADVDGDGLIDVVDMDTTDRSAGASVGIPPRNSDSDASPDFLDRDSDDDGLTDTREWGGDDADGDGAPDACVSVGSDGRCSAGGLSGAFRNTDSMDQPDYLDEDSDNDGIDDVVEAHDTNGNGSIGGSEPAPLGTDGDDDGIDDGFDPDAAGGAPVTDPLGAVEDADGDGTPDWRQLCGDGYATGSEPCDTGTASASCTAMCLLTDGESCSMGTECDSGFCIGSVCGQPSIDLVDPDGSGPLTQTSVTPTGTAPGFTAGNTITVNVTGPGVSSSCMGTVTASETFTCSAPISGLQPGESYTAVATGTEGSVSPMDSETFVLSACAGRDTGDACMISGVPMGVCDMDGGLGACVVCVDTMTGAAIDSGCVAAAPLCVLVSGAPTCVVCQDSVMGGQDLGCGAGDPVCDDSNPSAPVCVTCEDNVSGSGVDNGCAAPNGRCAEMLGGPPMCVECLGDADCPMVGVICGPLNTCVPGCNDNSDCVTAERPVCDVPARMCVQCLVDADCAGTTVCDAGGMCSFPDTDGDTITDDIDLDDDNDGIPDVNELGGTDLSDDDDSDGVADYLDPDSVTCTDSEPDGVCDALPASVDFDGDGVPNHLDLDADGDGLVDHLEGGGEDTDGDGIVDGFSDLNGNGLDDALEITPLTLPNSDATAGPDFLDLDSDDDGLTDTLEGGGTDSDGDGRPDGSLADSNGDGLADALSGAGALPAPDTDGDSVRDYRDVDSDDDGVPDTLEAFDGDEDGTADVTPAGADSDGDGLDDNFDGVPPAEPNTDGTGAPNWRDIDSDGDGITDEVECPVSSNCADTDNDGTPDFLDLDADGDTIPDASEGHDVDHDGTPDVTPEDNDTDGDGLDDAFDADCASASDCSGVIGVPAPTPDLDTDGAPDFQDPEDDGDGIATATEVQDAMDYAGPAANPEDVDGDGLTNWYDTDSDADLAPDVVEDSRPTLDGDLDDNGILDYLDPSFAPLDTDEDGVLDAIECPGIVPVGPTCPDSDGDGAPDFNDVDDDNDGILTSEEYSAPDPEDGDPASDRDADNDGIPNHLDLDADNDGIPDLRENGPAALDADGDGRPDAPMDTDGDGLDQAFDSNDNDPSITTTSSPTNTDGQGPPDYLDLDADDDGIRDIVEADGVDSNQNGVVDVVADTDMDGLADVVDPDAGGTPWPTPDTDTDGAFDFQDTDTDGDLVPDSIEGHDVNADGNADILPSGADLNLDGVDDAYLNAAALPDRDSDDTPDWRDRDDDGDGIPTSLEDVDGDTNPRNDDSDGDGTPDYLDPDDDGDGVDTRFESPDPNGDGLVDDAQDTDGDGTPDYLDVDDDNDGLPTASEDPDPNGDGNPSDALDSDSDGVPDYLDDTEGASGGGVSGGALCSANSGRSGGGAFVMLLGFLGLTLRRRRRG